MGEVFKLFGTIGVDNKEAKKSLDEVENKGKTTANKLTDFFGKLSGKFGKTFSSMGSKLDLSGVHNQFNVLGEKINQTLVKGIQSTAKAMAIGGAAAMATAGATLIKGMNLAGELEQNMGGSVAVFGKYAEKMQQTGSAAFNTMGLSQSDFLASANKMGSLFQGAGFSMKDSMTMTSESMQRASDVASIMGLDINSAMEAVGGMAKGNFTMMDNLGIAMNDTTIGNYALSKGIEKTTAEMTTQEKVGLATQMFLEKTSKYAGNYAKENDTLAGSLQTAKSALSNFMSGAASIDDVITEGLNFAEVAGRTAKELAPKLFTGIWKAIQTLIPKIPSLLSSLAENIASVLAKVFGDEAREAFGVLVDIIVETVDALIAAFDFIVKYKDMFTPIAVGIATVVGLLSAYNIVMKVSKGIQTAYNAVMGVGKGIQAAWAVMTKKATAEQIALNAAMSVNPIAIIIIAIVGLVAALVYFFTKTETGIKIWKKFTTFLVDTWTNVKEKAIEIWNSVADFMSNIWESITEVVSNAAKSLSDFLKNIWETIKTIAQTVWNVIFAVVGGIITSYIAIWKGIFEGFKIYLGMIWDAIKSIATTIWNVIGDSVMAIINRIVSTAVAIFNGFKAVLTTVFNAIRAVITTVWQAISNVVTTIVNVLSTVVISIFNGLKNSITTIFNAIRSIASSVWNAIKNVISTVVQTAVNIAVNIFNGFKSTVSSIWNGIKSAITTVVNTVKSTIQNVWGTLKGIVSGVFDSVKSAIEKPMNKAKDIVKSIIDTIKGFFDFNISWPKIPMPHFSISPKGWGVGDLLKGKIPTLGIDWFAKGGIMTEPTAFGLNGDRLMVGGEAGAEAIAPIDTLLDYVVQAVRTVMSENQGGDGDINVTQYITSPEPLTPREVAKETTLRLQDLAILR